FQTCALPILHQLHIVTSSGYLWDTVQERAIEKGNLIHLIISNIKTKDDIDFVFDVFINSGKLSITQAKELRPIVDGVLNHPQLQHYYESHWIIYNEKDILTKSNLIIRPDRLNRSEEHTSELQ